MDKIKYLEIKKVMDLYIKTVRKEVLKITRKYNIHYSLEE